MKTFQSSPHSFAPDYTSCIIGYTAAVHLRIISCTGHNCAAQMMHFSFLTFLSLTPDDVFMVHSCSKPRRYGKAVILRHLEVRLKDAD